MAVRDFNGSGDKLIVDNGAIATFNAGAACSMLFLMKQFVTTGTRAWGSALHTASGTIGTLYSTSSTDLVWGDDLPGQDKLAVASFVGIIDQTTQWVLVGMDTPGGTGVAFRFHGAVLGGSWIHSDSATGAANATTCDAFAFGSFSTGAPVWHFRIAAAAAWATTRLTDANYESVGTAKTTASIAALSPTALWDFNQADVSTPVTDLTGNGADENVGLGSRTGTTVVTTDDPPGWVFGLETAIPLMWHTAIV